MPPLNQPAVFNPPPIGNSFMSGFPPVEVAQPAIPQNIQRNPTPPPGWNDPPPATKLNRTVSVSFNFTHILVFT